jgi:glutamine synthetase
MRGTLDFSGKEDVARFISDNHIRILDLCHIPEDGRLKTLSFSIENRDKIYEILDFGERVDGSNLFSFIEPGKSDIYIAPKVERAFVNPFAILPTLNIFCDYLDENGKPLDISPKNVLARAEERLRSSTGITLRALAELEFYIIAKPETEMLFPEQTDKNYHESAPFARFEQLRNEVLAILDSIGIATKYGHSEVGQVWSKDNVLMEQHEIELTPQSLSKTAETISIAKWVIRNICARHGVSASFIPKIDLAHAGTGMHIHMCTLRNGENIVANPDGTLSKEALRMIGGILKFAPSLSAFGNPTPVSYLRFIARKESPMHICWSARNRLALIRIPLWWHHKKEAKKSESCRETFEYRAPDAFANAYLLLAGLAVAANYGLENSKQALKIAEDLHVEAASRELKKLKALPISCSESAKNLEKDRQFYEAHGVFPRRLIDKTVEKLETYGDKNLWNKIFGKPEQIEKTIMEYLHYG